MKKSTQQLVKTIVAIYLLVVIFYVAYAFAEGEASQNLKVGVVIGEKDIPVYYYDIKTATDANVIGFFYPGAQVTILEYDTEWSHIMGGREGYIKTASMSISSPFTEHTPSFHSTLMQPIGFALVDFPLDDPDIDPNGFIELLLDCDRSQGGDPLSNGMVLKLIGYAGNMLQVQNSNYDGFIHSKYAKILTLQDLFAENKQFFTSGIYHEGEDFDSGLYRASSNGIGVATITITNANEDELTFRLAENPAVFSSLYIPRKTKITISENGIMTPILSKDTIDRTEYQGGRILSGLDAYLDLASDYHYDLTADDGKEAYYVISTIWDDALFASGQKYTLEEGERKSRFRIPAGSFVELFDCKLVKQK